MSAKPRVAIVVVKCLKVVALPIADMDFIVIIGHCLDLWGGHHMSWQATSLMVHMIA